MSLPAKFERLFTEVNLRHAWDMLGRAYSAYADDPASRARQFGVMRALVTACRRYGLGGSHARLMAEMGRVDDEAPAHWQLVLEHRKPTRPHREKKKRDKALRTSSQSWARRKRRFAAVLHLMEKSDQMALPAAWEAVAAAEHVTAEAVRKDYRAEVRWYRKAGLNEVEFGNEDALTRIELPRPGRPRKKG